MAEGARSRRAAPGVDAAWTAPPLELTDVGELQRCNNPGAGGRTGDRPARPRWAERVDAVRCWRSRDLKVHFPIKRGLVFDRRRPRLRGGRGDLTDPTRARRYGLVGESGCGKSTLGRACCGWSSRPPVVIFDGDRTTRAEGRALRRLRRRMQMIFQDPLSSPGPPAVACESILARGWAHGIGADRASEAGSRELLDAVGLPASALRKYPHEFSGGQRQRIGIARALALGPDLIIADEPVSALDVSIQAQVINLLEELQDELGLTYLVIAHDLAVVRHISDTVGVMYLGALVEEAPSDDLYAEPLHPYTRALMSAVPVPDPEVEDRRERILLSGDLPSPANPPAGCRFHTRCPWAQPERCGTNGRSWWSCGPATGWPVTGRGDRRRPSPAARGVG